MNSWRCCILFFILSTIFEINSEWIAEGETYTVRSFTSDTINYITVDNYGNNAELLITYGSHHLRGVPITPDGNITTLVDNPSGLPFRTVTAIVQKDSQTMLLVDKFNHCVRRFDTVSLNLTDYAGKCEYQGNQAGELLASEFQEPFDMIQNDAGNYYLSDSKNQKITLLNETHVSNVATVCQHPKGLLLDTDEKYLYVAVNNGIAVLSILLSTVVKEIAHQNLKMPNHLTWLPEKSSFLVADSGSEKILIFNKAGDFKYAICAGPNRRRQQQIWNKDITLIGNFTTCFLDEPVTVAFTNNTLYIGQVENITAIHLSFHGDEDRSPELQEDRHFRQNVTVCSLTITRRPTTTTTTPSKTPPATLTTIPKPSPTTPTTTTKASTKIPTTTLKLSPTTSKPSSNTTKPSSTTTKPSPTTTKPSPTTTKPSPKIPNLTTKIPPILKRSSTDANTSGWVTPVVAVVVVLVVIALIAIGIVVFRKMRAGRHPGSTRLHWVHDGEPTLSYARLRFKGQQ